MPPMGYEYRYNYQPGDRRGRSTDLIASSLMLLSISEQNPSREVRTFRSSSSSSSCAGGMTKNQWGSRSQKMNLFALANEKEGKPQDYNTSSQSMHSPSGSTVSDQQGVHHNHSLQHQNTAQSMSDDDYDFMDAEVTTSHGWGFFVDTNYQQCR